ncbi:catechol 2,3-dioxygenase-like lactoylglutathione lyase family enzyme [Nocardia transvalensis]|uniref:Catechol 2,3-dioxygenase-like lactoylglutathione lyase family enzyme n=1 Tax=Nocardia transvalensis TaxID=37333 RepID=A0A7W9UGE1_9NOCA|nr:VOC family protein [Nocardia transvalensis]MBB5911986.1 catechol 2,3-dioxygenase-like lactoylglutathione lyase family enzyme [Nocardia transvalensis]
MTVRLNVIGVVVSDMAAALAFYRRLGLEFGEDLGGHVEASLPGGFRLTLDTEENIRSFAPDIVAGLRPGSAAGRIGLAFECATPAEVDAVFEDLTGAGYHGELKPFDAFWGQRYASVHDPDGNGVDLYAPLG